MTTLVTHSHTAGIHWQVPAYYTPPVLIGVGSFGAVGSSIDSRTGEEVAIKKIQNPFFLNRIQAVEAEHRAAVAGKETVRAQQIYAQSQQIQRQAKQLYREVKLLRFMTHPNIIAMRDIYISRTADGGEDVYIVMQKMGADLKRIVQVQVLSDEHCQHITYQIVKAIAYVNSAGIMHRDLKPENIAMNENMELRVLDFGMARGVNQTGSGHTGYVVTRHYRAPEVLCFEFDAEKLNYTEGVDSWALGCIIAEQITGQVLFQGSNFIEQLSAIGEKLGRPPQSFVAAIANEDVRAFTNGLPEHPAQTLAEYFEANKSVGEDVDVNPHAIDLITRLVAFHPAERLKACDALAHPYFASIRDQASELQSEVRFDESFEHMNLNVQGWHELFMMELLAVKENVDGAAAALAAAAGGAGGGGAAAAAAAAAAGGGF